jgi:5-methylcytosine-specific restriction protein A
MRGYYVVYLFSADGREIHLSLNQGTTAVRSEFKVQARDILRDRAGLMRHRLNEHATAFETYELRLGSQGTLAKDYEAGHALGTRYEVETLPPEEQLRSTLQAMARAYLALTFRGGLDPSFEIKADGQVTDGDGVEMSLTEARRYRVHRKIERNGRASRDAKKIHGLVCQACGFDFAEKYGQLGAGYIEAHHLKPLSQLVEGVPITFSIKDDFAVLCANCHRMIHRSEAPLDLERLRLLIREGSK